MPIALRSQNAWMEDADLEMNAGLSKAARSMAATWWAPTRKAVKTPSKKPLRPVLTAAERYADPEWYLDKGQDAAISSSPRGVAALGHTHEINAGDEDEEPWGAQAAALPALPRQGSIAAGHEALAPAEDEKPSTPKAAWMFASRTDIRYRVQSDTPPVGHYQPRDTLVAPRCPSPVRLAKKHHRPRTASPEALERRAQSAAAAVEKTMGRVHSAPMTAKREKARNLPSASFRSRSAQRVTVTPTGADVVYIEPLEDIARKRSGVVPMAKLTKRKPLENEKALDKFYNTSMEGVKPRTPTVINFDFQLERKPITDKLPLDFIYHVQDHAPVLGHVDFKTQISREHRATQQDSKDRANDADYHLADAALRPHSPEVDMARTTARPDQALEVVDKVYDVAYDAVRPHTAEVSFADMARPVTAPSAGADLTYDVRYDSVLPRVPAAYLGMPHKDMEFFFVTGFMYDGNDDAVRQHPPRPPNFQTQIGRNGKIAPTPEGESAAARKRRKRLQQLLGEASGEERLAEMPPAPSLASVEPHVPAIHMSTMKGHGDPALQLCGADVVYRPRYDAVAPRIVGKHVFASPAASAKTQKRK